MIVPDDTVDLNKPRAPWMPFWGTDFMASTLGWSVSERGAYMLLLWAAWEGNGLPADAERVFRLDPDIRAAWHVLEDKFPVAGDGRRRNPRQERERVEMIQLVERRAQRAKKAAAARWDATSIACASPQAMRNECHTHTHTHTHTQTETETEKTHSIIQAVDLPATRRRVTIPRDALEELWDRFPRKVGKKKAMALMEKVVREIMREIEHDEPTDALIVLGERIDLLAQQHRTTEPQFIPHPTTWLNQGRYLDPVDDEAMR